MVTAQAAPTSVLPSLPTASITGVELLFPGRFAGVRGGSNVYSEADIQGAVEAFQELKGVFTPKAKIGHGDKQTLLSADELPSAGDVTSVYRKGDRLCVDVNNVPGKLAQLIKAGAYGPRSAELLLNAEFNGKTYPLVLKGFAWLGATPPAVSNLNDIVALYSLPEGESTFVDAEGHTVTVVELAAPHPPFGTADSPANHEHAHSAYGDQAGDASHSHDHSHQGDSDHNPSGDVHKHDDAPPASADAGDDAEAQMAAAPTKTENGKSFTKGDYAYTPSAAPGSWKLRLTNTPGGAPDSGIVGAAAAALGPGFRGQKVDIPDADRPAVIAKVRAAWTKANPDKKADEMPDVLKPEAKHSRSPLAALARLLRLSSDEVALADGDTGTDVSELTDAQLLQHAIGDVEQYVVREAQEQLDGEDEDNDIRAALAARDILQQLVKGEMAEVAGLDLGDMDNSGAVAAYFAAADDDAAKSMQMALDTIQGHLDGMGKGKKGVGMARLAHKLLAGSVKSFMAQPKSEGGIDNGPGSGDAQPKSEGGIDTAGNTDASEGPEGENAQEQEAGAPKHLAREEETVNDTELRALLGVDEGADLKQALLALKGRSVDLSDFQALQSDLQQIKADREVELAARNEADAVRLVDRAIDEHKINPRQRDWALGRAKADREDFEVFLSTAPATAWPAGELGRAGDAPGAPTPLPPRTYEIARVLGVSDSELAASQEKPFSVRLLEAKQQAAATAGKKHGGRGAP